MDLEKNNESKETRLQQSISLINECINSDTPWSPTECDYLKQILKLHLSENKQYHSRILNFVREEYDLSFQKNIYVNILDLRIALRLINDELFELSLDREAFCNKDSAKYRKMLLARYSNNNFDEQLSKILSSNWAIVDAFYRYVLHQRLDESCRYPNEADHYINEYIAQNDTKNITLALEEIRLPDMDCNNNFQNEFAKLIKESLQMCSIRVNLDYALKIDSITKALRDIEFKTTDDNLNNLIHNATEFWFKNEAFGAVQKLWDAFERTKTILGSGTDKKNGATLLLDKITAEIYPNNRNAKEHTQELLNNEFKSLTSIGNDYNIRHSEIHTLEINNKPKLIEYFMSRMIALLNLSLPIIKAQET